MGGERQGRGGDRSERGSWLGTVILAPESMPERRRRMGEEPEAGAAATPAAAHRRGHARRRVALVVGAVLRALQGIH